MDLQSVGKTPVSGRSEVEATHNTLRYHWSEQVEEWFINDQRGLEQGWTISEHILYHILRQTIYEERG